ncbi:MAG: M28 family peptidase [Algibacter sp.]
MYQIFVLLFILGQGISVYAQSRDTDPILFDKSTLLQHVKTLSSDAFEGRRTGTKGAIKTQKYIINQFHSLGVKPLKKSFVQSFSFTKGRHQYNATNVLGLIKGTEKPNKYIVISAHYDHEGIKSGKIFNGADDNASGVSALFSFAQYFKTNPPKHSVIFAAFDAEELGIRGSKYFINNPEISTKSIILNLNMDMISRSDKKELFVAGTAYNKSLKRLILNVKTQKNAKLVLGHDGYDGLDNWTYSSDHASFHKADIPFLYFGVEDHKDYHEPTDDFKNIHPEFYKDAVNLIISVFEKVDRNPF